MNTLSIFATFAALILFSSTAHAADAMTILRDNIVTQLTAIEPKNADGDPVALLKPDGSFSDIDYTPNPMTYLAFKHIGRLHDMAVAWGCPSSARYQNAALKSAILSAYNYWVAHDIQHRNWWFNEIGVPDSLSETMLILQKHDALPTDNFRKAIAIIDRASPRQKNLSAANLVWTAYATRNEGILCAFDPAATDKEKAAASALVKQSFERIGSTIRFTNSDGINVDYSFHAHGPMVYNGGYGLAWTSDTARIAASAAGTRYGIASDRLKLIIDYILGGDQFMIRGIDYDRATIGREWSRNLGGGRALVMRDAIVHLLSVEPNYRTAELTTMKKRIDDAESRKAANPADTVIGNRAYYTADYMAQQRGAYLISIKTSSKRTNLPEAMNGENGKGGLAYNGMNLIYRTGDEYLELQPQWDWYRLPGTTGERAASGVGGTYDIKPPTGKRAGNVIAGGASDGMVGTQAFAFSQHNVTANKSWFLFDRGEVAMGNLITESKPAAAGDIVGTNINQTLLHGQVVYSTAPDQSTTLGTEQSVTPKGLRWVNHDSVGYFFIEPVDNATIRDVARAGSWRDINIASYPGEKVSKGIFDLDLDHGPAPVGASYVYAVIPGLSADQMDAFLTAKPFTVLRNDAVAQAVTDKTANITEANFYKPGDVELSPALKLTLATPDRSASVLLRRTGAKFTMSVASPDHFAGPLTLQLTGHYTGDNAHWDAAAGITTFNLTLPAGPTAGSTVTQTFDAAS